MKKIKYFTKDSLIMANREAVRTKRRRSLHEHLLLQLPNHLRFPVGVTIPHSDYELRLSLAVGPSEDKLQIVWLDVPYGTYNGLPEVEVPS